MELYQIRVLSELGNGYGVFLVNDRSGNALAAKIWVGQNEDRSLKFERYKQMRNEISILSGTLRNCPGVPSVTVFDSAAHLVICSSPVGQTLDDYPLPVDSIERDSILEDWGRQIALVLVELHTRKGVIHRDIKPANIIICEGRVSLIDFGFALLEKDVFSIRNMVTVVGTEAYASERFHYRLPLHPHDDFQSLAFSLYALRLGTDKWIQLVKSKQKPSFVQVCSEVPFISKICRGPGEDRWGPGSASWRSTVCIGAGLLTTAVVCAGLAFRYL